VLPMTPVSSDGVDWPRPADRCLDPIDTNADEEPEMPIAAAIP